MPVNCSKCSRPIALTDIVASNAGRLSHRDCQGPNTLTPEERVLVFVYCSGHFVAWCPICDISYRYTDLAAEMVGGNRTNMCPRCHRELTEAVRAHLFNCAMLPSEVQVRAQEVRQAALRVVKESQQARDRSELLIREAEAHLFERQRALRVAMSRGAAS